MYAFLLPILNNSDILKLIWHPHIRVVFCQSLLAETLVHCSLQFKSKKPGFFCQDTRRLARRRTAYQRVVNLIDRPFWQINQSVSCSRQPITWPQCAHIISGAVRLGWSDRNPQKFDSFTGETTVQGLFHSSFQFFFLQEHYSLWAWGCHSQKATTRSPTIPAAWAKRKRTGRLKKVRLVLRWNKPISIISILNGRQQEFHPENDTLHAFVSLLQPQAILTRCCASCLDASLWQTVFV